MNNVIEQINKRIALLERAIRRAEKDKEIFPEGRLRTSKTGGRVRYYKVDEKGDTNGTYLHKTDESNLIKYLAQKDYNKRFIKKAREERKLLEKCLQQYQNAQAEVTYKELSPERQKLVYPYILTTNLIVREWQSKKFKQNPYKPEKRIFDTRRGEKVRSKSEAIIADMLYELGIPYRYEYPVRMCDGKIKYPDFTLLQVKTGEVIYFEHFGRMDEEVYRKDTIEKMNIYRESGIYPGKNLMFTFETEDCPLDINGARKMLTEVFCS